MTDDMPKMPDRIYIVTGEEGKAGMWATHQISKERQKTLGKLSEYIRADLASVDINALPFTGHAHTLREDIDFLYGRLMGPNSPMIARPEHTAALLYNLKRAVDFCESHGIKTFGAEALMKRGGE